MNHKKRWEDTQTKSLWEDFVDLMDEMHYIILDDEPCTKRANKLLNALEEKYCLSGIEDKRREYPNPFYPENPLEKVND